MISETAVKTGEWINANTPTYEVTEENPFYPSADGGGDETIPVQKPEVTYRKNIDITLILSLIWLFVSVIFFAVHMLRYRAFRGEIDKRSAPVTDAEIIAVSDSVRHGMGIRRKIPIREWTYKGNHRRMHGGA